MVQLGREAQSLAEYILGTYSCLFRNVSIRDPQQKLNNYIFLCCLHRASLREHTKYLWWRTWIPHPPLTTLARENRLFAALQRSIHPKNAGKNVWILEGMWRLVNKKVSM